MSASPPKVSVVVTVLNDRAGMAALLESLLVQSVLPDEVVVVDGGSTDGTAELLADFHPTGMAWRYLPAAGINIAAGRNLGIRNARHEIIACTDSGCVADRDWLRELVAPFADPTVEVVGGAYEAVGQTRFEQMIGLLTMPGQLFPIDVPRFNPSARCVAFRVSAWRKAEGFPEWLYTAEDTLFDCKLRRLGAVFAYAPRAIVRWRPRSSVGGVWRQFRNYARGEAHLGRARETLRFWQKRYALAMLAIVAGLGVWVLTGQLLAAPMGLLVAAGLLFGPLHARARAVARRLNSPGAWLTGLLYGQWVALAGVRGSLLGRRDRQQKPGVYVDRLQEYWGAECVEQVPDWTMVRSPAPRTLIVAWHWPPANRASANVLAGIFHGVDPANFRVVTRGTPLTAEPGPPVPPVPATTVPWPLPDDREVRGRTWLASIRTCLALLREARRINCRWPVQRVLAVHPHRYSLLAGWLAAWWLGVPFVAYMHDLLVETSISRNRFKRRFWEWVDRRALSAAWMILVPTAELAEHYRRRGLGRSWVLPHCRPIGLTGSTPPRLATRTGPPSPGAPLRLIYSGSIYQAHTDAVAVLLEAVAPLLDARLSFLSNPHPLLAGQEVRWLPRGPAYAALHQGDVGVVCLGARTPYPQEIQACFPSKIVDYLTVGRPILAIVPAGCFVERLIRDTGCGQVVTTFCARDVARTIEAFSDREQYARMASAAQRLGRQLDAGFWSAHLELRLRQGPSGNASDPPFPAAEAEDGITTMHEAEIPESVGV